MPVGGLPVARAQFDRHREAFRGSWTYAKLVEKSDGEAKGDTISGYSLEYQVDPDDEDACKAFCEEVRRAGARLCVSLFLPQRLASIMPSSTHASICVRLLWWASVEQSCAVVGARGRDRPGPPVPLPESKLLLNYNLSSPPSGPQPVWSRCVQVVSLCP